MRVCGDAYAIWCLCQPFSGDHNRPAQLTIAPLCRLFQPFSGDHMARALRWVAGSGQPWLLLLPNYVCLKPFYRRALLAGRQQPAAGARVSPFLAFLARIGSPCLRHCVHGAPIGGQCWGGWGGRRRAEITEPGDAAAAGARTALCLRSAEWRGFGGEQQLAERVPVVLLGRWRALERRAAGLVGGECLRMMMMI
jgi:hypothetical protein